MVFSTLSSSFVDGFASVFPCKALSPKPVAPTGTPVLL